MFFPIEGSTNKRHGLKQLVLRPQLWNPFVLGKSCISSNQVRHSRLDRESQYIKGSFQRKIHDPRRNNILGECQTTYVPCSI